MAPPGIEAADLRKEFGSITAVDGIAFSVGAGEVLGFLGPNGAGKTTTMRMLTGYLRPTGGSVLICGIDMLARPVQAKARIGYLPEGAPLYPEMTPASFLNFAGRVRGLQPPLLRARLAEVSEMVHLEEVWNQPIDTLSKGYKRRLGLAQAILHDPDILILDEPTDGLDPNQKREVRDLVRRLGRSKAIIVSTHILEEVHAVCTRALILARGSIVADGTPADLERMAPDHNAVSIVIPAERAPAIADVLGRLPCVRDVARETEAGGRSILRAFPVEGRPILKDVADTLRQQDVAVHEMKQEPGRLEEVFRRLTETRESPAEGDRP